jgi:RNA polymerase sigma factor (TIGR02999 family)
MLADDDIVTASARDATGARDVTALLLAWEGGDPEALERLLPLVYDELRRIGERQLRGERGLTLQPTAVVHEAYLRLVDQGRANWQNRSQFYAVAARMMRRVLVDHARRRGRVKRGGGTPRISFDEGLDEAAGQIPSAGGRLDPVDLVDLIDLHDALERLGQLDAEQARIVELRYFGGLTIEETAAVLGSSPATVKRDWSSARAWLYRELHSAPP